jgi:hypothetical protein
VWAKIWDNQSCYTLLVGIKNGANSLDYSLTFALKKLNISKKLSIHLVYNFVIPLLGIYTIAIKAYVHTKTCTQIFIDTLFLIAQT